MHLLRVLAACGFVCLAIALPRLLAATASTSLSAAAQAAWGGKMEHCAIAVGMIGGAILGMFANPMLGAIAIGVMTAGLVWLTTCA